MYDQPCNICDIRQAGTSFGNLAVCPICSEALYNLRDGLRPKGWFSTGEDRKQQETIHGKVQGPGQRGLQQATAVPTQPAAAAEECHGPEDVSGVWSVPWETQGWSGESDGAPDNPAISGGGDAKPAESDEPGVIEPASPTKPEP